VNVSVTMTKPRLVPSKYQQIPNVRVWAQGRGYVEAAEILLDYNRILPAAIMAALALEIFVKSFFAVRYRSGHATTDHGHSLCDLFRNIDQQTQAELLVCSTEVNPKVKFLSELKKHDSVFTSARYWYEPTAPSSVGSDIVYFSRHLCDSVFLLGQKRDV